MTEYVVVVSNDLFELPSYFVVAEVEPFEPLGVGHFGHDLGDAVAFGVELFEGDESVERGQLLERVGRQVEDTQGAKARDARQGADLVAVQVEYVETLQRFQPVGRFQSTDNTEENLRHFFFSNRN